MASRGVQDRQWWVDGDPLVCDDEEELSQALGDAVRILTRIGGGFSIVAQREEVQPGYFQTQGFVFKWSSFVPAKRQEEVALEPIADPEPAVA